MALGNNGMEYLEELPEKLVEYWAMLELDILRDMARKLRAAELYIPATEYQHRKLSLLGMMYNDILELLAGALGSTFDAIEEIITNEGINTLREEAGKYRTAAELGLLEAVPERKLGSVTGAVGAEELTEAQVRANIANLLENDDAEAQAIKQIIDAGIAKTEGTFSNLTGTTANTAIQQFERALDRAYMQVSTGAFSLEKAVEDAVEELAAQGIGSITYPSGRVDTIEVAVRRAVVTGTNQTNLKLREQFADEMECDLVEVSAHEGARPTHAEWQGKIYSRKGNDPKYPSFVESTGYGTGPGLGGWNCRHTFSAYFEGMPRAWSDEELEQLKNETVEYKGEQIPRYVAQQRMREMERSVRKYRREAAVAGEERAVGLLEKEREARARYVDFCKETGLKEQPERFRVASAGDGLTESGKDGNIKSKGLARAQNSYETGAPMPPEQLSRIKKAFERNGGVIQQDLETDQYLAERNAEGITYDAKTILLRMEPSRAAVFEELIHTEQYRNGRNDGSEYSRIVNEIEAQEKLLKHAKAYQLDYIDIRNTQRALDEYKKQLDMLKGG